MSYYVSVRFNMIKMSEGLWLGKCLNLPDVEVLGTSREDVCINAKAEVEKVVEKILQSAYCVPWVDPPVHKDDKYDDGGNQTIWVELPVAKDNLPPGNMLVYCISCGIEMHSEYNKDTIPWCPRKGLVCQTSGNYGSTIFDPTDSKIKLYFYLCDECALKKADIIRYTEWTRPRSEPKKIQTFQEHIKDQKDIPPEDREPVVEIPWSPMTGLP